MRSSPFYSSQTLYMDNTVNAIIRNALIDKMAGRVNERVWLRRFLRRFLLCSNKCKQCQGSNNFRMAQLYKTPHNVI